MKKVTIPDSFLPENDSSIQLFDYQSSENIEKLYINLSKHAFSFLIEGQKEVISSNTTISIANTAFLLMESGHCLMTEKVSSVNKNYRSILLFFSDDDILNFLRKSEIQIDNNKSKKSAYSFQYDNFISSFVKSIIEIAKLPKNKQKNLLPLKLEEILIYLVEKNGTHFLHSILSSSKDQKNQKLISVVETNKLNKLSINELAFLCNMSVSSFKRAFVKHYEQPPIKWFQDRRLEYASILLKQEQKRPSDIYLDIGYENLSSFIQAFKSKYGVTPKQYQ